MQATLMAILLVILLAAAAYVQLRLPRFTRGGPRVWIARLLLFTVGVAFGLAMSTSVESGMLRLLAFLIGFGSVHVPAAAILFLKAKRAEGKS